MQPVINLKWLVAVEVILQNLKDIVSIILFRDGDVCLAVVSSSDVVI
jgi:hypothetical protein